MKYLVILILVGFVLLQSVNMAHGLWIPQSPEKLFEQSETVFVGTVTIVNEIEFQRSNTFYIEEDGITRMEIENYTQTLDEYTVTVEEFLKNPQTSNTITMLEATVGGVPGRSVSIGGFDLGDRVLFYVPKIDGTNQYSPESFEIPEQCDAKSVLEQPRVFLFNDFRIMQDGVVKNDNFVANKPIEFVYNKDMDTLEGKIFGVNIKISKINGNDWEPALDKQIHTESKLCEWTSTASWEFVPTAGRYYMWMSITEGDHVGVETSSRGFTVKEFDFPLKQFKSGIISEKITCNEDLQLIQKYDGTPACVTESTKQKLIERGWTAKDDSILKTSTTCMTLEQSKETAPFFKTPAYLPDGYSYVCSQSGTPSESYIVYHHQEIQDWNIPELISDGAIFIYQIDERNIISAEKLETLGAAEQRTKDDYDSVMEGNPSLQPQLIRINGILAYAVDSCPDCGIQTANLTDGTFVQKSTSTETKIKFIDENGVNYMLKTTLPLDELILVAESLQ